MQLSRPSAPPRLISLVSMIDVLLIMLVFFMVTSTYLDLDMIPVAETSEGGSAETIAPSAPLMIRLSASGQPFLRGKPVPAAELASIAGPGQSVLILPSPRASTQSLVSVMDTLTRAGVTRLRIVQVADAP